jgi:hypothetical protein
MVSGNGAIFSVGPLAITLGDDRNYPRLMPRRRSYRRFIATEPPYFGPINLKYLDAKLTRRSSVADGEALADVLALFELIDQRDRVIVIRDRALAIRSRDHLIEAETELAGALARSDVHGR